MMTRLTIETPLGPLWLAATESGLAGVWFEGQRYFPADAAQWPIGRGGWLDAARAQLDEYFAGKRRVFDLPLDGHGTPFQRRVWNALREIPYGATTTYGAIGSALDLPNGARAVGAAVGRNPVSIVVPCHRVLGSQGSLTGYAGGLDRKARLLELEGAPTAARHDRG